MKLAPEPYDDTEDFEALYAIFDDIKALADQIAAIGGPVATWGDGKGGMILEVLETSLVEAGIRPGQPQAIPAGRRQVASGSTHAHQRLHRVADAYQGWYCSYCQCALIDVCDDADTELDAHGRRLLRPGVAKESASIDHLIPVSAGGSNEIRNLRLACMPCNMKKGSQ